MSLQIQLLLVYQFLCLSCSSLCIHMPQSLSTFLYHLSYYWFTIAQCLAFSTQAQFIAAADICLSPLHFYFSPGPKRELTVKMFCPQLTELLFCKLETGCSITPNKERLQPHLSFFQGQRQKGRRRCGLLVADAPYISLLFPRTH